MGILTSKLLAGDARLEACAVSDPSHVTPGSSGGHVRKIQDALNLVAGAGISGAEYDASRYGSQTVAAVVQFKQDNNILNYAGAIDNIVGKKTIVALDSAAAGQDGRRVGMTDQSNYVDIVVWFAGGGGWQESVDGEIKQIPFGQAYRQDPATKDYKSPDGHRRLRVLSFGAAAQMINVVGRALAKFDAETRPNETIGKVFIHGFSNGGRYAIEFAATLSTRGQSLKYVAVVDAAHFPYEAIKGPDDFHSPNAFT